MDPMVARVGKACHNIVDPFEDTESLIYSLILNPWILGVTTSSIRSRILKARTWARAFINSSSVTTSSIRSRILKDLPVSFSSEPVPGHNIVDPFEDTESGSTN